MPPADSAIRSPVAPFAAPWRLPDCRRLARSLVALLFAWTLFGADAAWSDEAIRVEAVWDGEYVAVSASADLQVEVDAMWSVLTDYEHFADFIPDMSSSHVIARSRDGVTVEHNGQFGFLFFRQPMRLVLEVVLDHPRRILARSIGGDLRDLTSSYEISRSPRSLRLVYSARFLPTASLPPFIGLAVVRHQMERQFAAMVGEIVRRSAAGALTTQVRAER